MPQLRHACALMRAQYLALFLFPLLTLCPLGALAQSESWPDLPAPIGIDPDSMGSGQMKMSPGKSHWENYQHAVGVLSADPQAVTTADVVRAVIDLGRAARAGYGPAAEALGDLHYDSKMAGSPKEGLAWYRQAMKTGQSGAMVKSAGHALAFGREKLAKQYLKNAMTLLDPLAFAVYGHARLTDMVDAEPGEPGVLYALAVGSQGGSGASAFNMALYIAKGSKAELRAEEIQAWLLRSHVLGCPEARRWYEANVDAFGKAASYLDPLIYDRALAPIRLRARETDGMAVASLMQSPAGAPSKDDIASAWGRLAIAPPSPLAAAANVAPELVNKPIQVTERPGAVSVKPPPASSAKRVMETWRAPAGMAKGALIAPMDSGANLRGGPSERAPIVGTTAERDVYQVISEEGGWLYVTMVTRKQLSANLTKAWIYGPLVKLVVPGAGDR